MSRREPGSARAGLRAVMLCVAAASALAGCAHRGLYSWGGYDQLLYESYKDPQQALVAQQSLREHIAALEAAHAKVAPGLYAEVGTFCLQAGDRGCAAEYYRRESVAWPESRTLMDSLVRHLATPPVAAVAASAASSSGARP